jgi:hypothetical protein
VNFSRWVGLLVVVASLVGCSSTSAPTPSHSVHLAHPTPEGGPLVGVDLDINSTNSHGLDMLASDISWLQDVLHVSNVQLVWYLQASDTAVWTAADQPDAAYIRSITADLRQWGFNVTYRVIFASTVPTLHLSDPQAWFASLLATEKPYLQVAQTWGVSEFIAGTERTTVEKEPEWGWFFAQAAHLYSGTLSYATWGGRPGYGGITGGNISEFAPVDDYGMTAYPSLNLPAGATQQQVTQGWETFLAKVPKDVLERTALDEVGIAASPGAYEDPWNMSIYDGRPIDLQVQAEWFTAACTVARTYHMRGVWFFPMFLSDDPWNPGLGASKFEGKTPAETAIRECAA